VRSARWKPSPYEYRMTKQATPQARLMVVRMLRCRLNRSACPASRKMELTVIAQRLHSARSTGVRLARPGLPKRRSYLPGDAPRQRQSAKHRDHRQRAERDRRGARSPAVRRTSPAWAAVHRRGQAVRAQPARQAAQARQQHAFQQEIRQDAPPRGAHALRSPISRVRSVTETSMMFITPTPPSVSVTTAIAPRKMVIEVNMVSTSWAFSTVSQMKVAPVVRVEPVIARQHAQHLVARGLPLVERSRDVDQVAHDAGVEVRVVQRQRRAPWWSTGRRSCRCPGRCSCCSGPWAASGPRCGTAVR
jgi:hypothetical protein